MNYTDINSKTIDSWIEEGWEWGRPIDHETFEKALEAFELSEEDKKRTVQRAKIFSYSKESKFPILYRHV